MRDLKRIPVVLELVRKAWEKNPDLRLGQLIENACVFDPFYTEDEELAELIKETYLENK